MATIRNEQEARHRANISLSHHVGTIDTLIVGEDASVYVNCDIKETKKQLDKKKEKYFVLKGETETKEQKTKDNESETE